MKQLQQKPYPVWLNAQPKAALKAALSHAGTKTPIVLCDATTEQHCLPLVSSLLPKEPPIVVPAGEQHKSQDMLQFIWQQLLARNADRNSILLVLGGGVLTDLGGFAAATYMRGIRWVAVPTSLIGITDAALGGKTGTNFYGLKNMVGAYHNPSAVSVATRFLNTLPEREWQSGIGEMLKHAWLAGGRTWQQAAKPIDRKDISTLLEAGIRQKLGLVRRDPYEHGPRKLLNLGHTFGHALEAWSLETEHPLPHGVCVAVGMKYAAQVSRLMGRMSKRSFNALVRTIDVHQFPEALMPLRFEPLLERMRHDKKGLAGMVRMVLPLRPGKCVWDVEVVDDMLTESYLRLSSS